MAKNSGKRYPSGFQHDAVERMKHCDDVQALAQELGVSRGALYLWKRKAEGMPSYRESAKAGGVVKRDDEQVRRIRQLEAEVAGLEGELGRRSLELSFFKSALRRVEGLRQQRQSAGVTPSTKKSAPGRSRKAN
jgi:hypothetical protein